MSGSQAARGDYGSLRREEAEGMEGEITPQLELST